MKNYGQYNSTVKSVLQAVVQAKNGYHLSQADIDALQEAIKDLQSIVEVHSN